MKIRRFIKKRRRWFRKFVENQLNGVHVRAEARPFVLDKIVAAVEGRPRY